MGNATGHFDWEEFKCPCCGKVHMDIDFLEMLETARVIAGVPFAINSGYRCEKHNKEVGSESVNHLSGRAADIHCADGPSRRKMLKGLIAAGFERIGIGKNFIHADSMDRIGMPKSFWVY